MSHTTPEGGSPGIGWTREGNTSMYDPNSAAKAARLNARDAAYENAEAGDRIGNIQVIRIDDNGKDKLLGYIKDGYSVDGKSFPDRDSAIAYLTAELGDANEAAEYVDNLQVSGGKNEERRKFLAQFAPFVIELGPDDPVPDNLVQEL